MHHVDSTRQQFPSESALQEVRHVPLWVKSMIVIGAILFLIQLPMLPRSFADAIQKSRATTAYNKGQYPQAIALYKALSTRYPRNTAFTKQLGFAYYHAGRYREALGVLISLAEVEMPQSEVDEIVAVIADIVTKLNHKT